MGQLLTAYEPQEWNAFQHKIFQTYKCLIQKHLCYVVGVLSEAKAIIVFSVYYCGMYIVCVGYFVLISQSLHSLNGKPPYRQNLAKSRNHDIGCYNGCLALQFATMPTELQSDWKGQNRNIADSRLHETLR